MWFEEFIREELFFGLEVEGNLGLDGGAFAWRRFNVEAATDHLHPFPHANQAKAFVPFGQKHAFNLEG